ncbi:LOW QUALITY PROTEIN: polyprotein [Phytophthora megakarya]|uniref:Polyprotein n=1 Tax=Phytophthora megakarya TaxID=4795 RepID=A0A225UJT6_9STRA|nr:LOW QUALITY PROTEIN: polyprotein [Phytophthora megakarya]
MERELVGANQRVQTLSRSKNDAVKIETSTYSGVGSDRLPLNRWVREIAITIASRLIEAPSAKVNFRLPRLTGKAQGMGIRHISCDLRLAFEPPQDESRVRSAFFVLKQGKMSMHDYIQKTRRLASCIVTKPIDMESQVHVFVSGMREGMTRFCFTRAEPGPLEKAFTIALREDYVVSSSYSRAMSAADRVDAPEPMEIDVIEAPNGRTWSSASANRGGHLA